jgi:DNA replication protein DnaC
MPTIRNSFADPPTGPAQSRYPTEASWPNCSRPSVTTRARRRSERRIKAAKFPREESLRAFDFEATPNIDPALIHTLAVMRRGPKADRSLGQSLRRFHA